MAHPVDIHVGKRLKTRRYMVGMSQSDLGEALGITFQQVQKYERGVNRMGSSRLFELAKVLSVPIAYFFEGYSDGEEPLAGMAESETPAFEYEDQISSRETMEMMRAYYKITDPAVKRRVYDLVKAMAETSKTG